jgi:hypothetical protein
MRRALTILTCLGILVFAGVSTALARGPYNGPPRGPAYGYNRGAYRAPWNAGYRGSYCVPRRTVAAYPAYPAYAGPVYAPTYPQVGFGIAGRNFSFWLAQ